MSRRPFRIAAVALSATIAITALSGCATGEVVAEPTLAATSEPATPTANPTPTPPPTPTPTTTTPTPTMDPAEPATWIITTTSMGPAALDAGEQEFVAALAPAFVPSSHCEGLTSLDAVDPSLGLGMWSSYGSDPADADHYSIRAMSIFAEDPPTETVVASPRTEAGIGLGSSLDDLRTAYPELEEWQDPRPGGDQKIVTEYTVTDDQGHLIVALLDDRVNAITATLDLPPTGYCG